MYDCQAAEIAHLGMYLLRFRSGLHLGILYGDFSQILPYSVKKKKELRKENRKIITR